MVNAAVIQEQYPQLAGLEQSTIQAQVAVAELLHRSDLVSRDKLVELYAVHHVVVQLAQGGAGVVSASAGSVAVQFAQSMEDKGNTPFLAAYKELLNRVQPSFSVGG